MLDPVGILISVSGVSLVVFLVWLSTRRAAPIALGGEAGARAFLTRELFGFQVGQIALDVGDRRGLATSADGRELVLFFVMGGRPTFWRVPVAKIGKLALRDAGDGQALLEIRTADFTRPKLSLTFASKAQVERLLAETPLKGALA